MVKKGNKKSTTNKSVIPLEQELPEIPDRKAWEIPDAYLEKDGRGSYKVVKKRRPSKTLLVNNIRAEVDAWRESNYTLPKGISETSLSLLNHWFRQDHIIGGEAFHFRFGQREAIETTIYLYELKKNRDNAFLAEKYMDAVAYGNDMFTNRKEIIETAREKRILTRVVPETGLQSIQDLPPLGLTRYCAKAATGSGKTFVMAFLIVWSYFHRKFERDSDLSKILLIIAPNVIVYERLKGDFENGKVFYDFPFIPPDWKYDWQMSFIMREDQVKTSTDGTVYLTNIHQIYESRASDSDEDLVDKPVGQLLGSKPKKDSTASWLNTFYDRVLQHNELLIINDEAHHVHDEELAWYKSIISFHVNLLAKKKKGLSMIFDLTATPKDTNGTYFPWIIADYPLAQAIEDKIVKTPLIVHQSDKSSPDGKNIANAFNAYNEWIQIAISRYREHFKCYGDLGQKPVLFIMAESINEAEQIAEGLRKISDFCKKDEVLLIHTKNDGSLSKDQKKLEELREAAHKIDNPKSKVKVVVSVLMLREGWDVKNVSIILGLRPFTSKANILPEQAIGRGLRLMQNLGPDYTQVLEIIGTDRFEEFVKQLETEGVGVGVTLRPPTIGINIYPIKTRQQFNIEIPVLTSSFTRKMEGLSTFDPVALPSIGELDEKGNFKELIVTLTHAATEKKVGTKQITISNDDFASWQEILTTIANKIISEGKFQNQFSIVFKILKAYVQSKCFTKKIDLERLEVRRTLSKNEITNKIVILLARALGEHTKVKAEMKVTNYPISLMELNPFLWKRKYVDAKKTVFNHTPAYNELEKAFSVFLSETRDILRFAALAESFTMFSITYLNKKGGRGLYYPDFVAVHESEKRELTHWIIETKGYEDENVPFKDSETEHWCEMATKNTNQKWKFIKVPDTFFRGVHASKFITFSDMLEKLESFNIQRKKIVINF